MASQKEPSSALNEVFSRALLDEEFRDRLYSEPAAALSEYKLSDVDTQILESIPRETLDGTAKGLREGSVVGASAQSVEIGVRVSGHFSVD